MRPASNGPPPGGEHRAGGGDVGGGRTRVVVVSDQEGIEQQFEEAFAVRRLSHRDAERSLSTASSEVVLVDATQTARLQETARLSLGGSRGVIVLGPPDDPAAATHYLDAGAYDYVSTLATDDELKARIRALARMFEGSGDDTITCGPLSVSARRREVRLDGAPVHLTPNEFAVLEPLARARGALVPHRELMSEVWGPEMVDARHYLRLYVRQLREKLEDDPASPKLILTERGAGYRLAVATATEGAVCT